ncbi:MAG TPA: nucleoside triphosphate pyrophosphohydrolase [Acidimicrobiia bacterium]|nr:nucleoside triphosphate pyrophosphohydrolase [Acidimicrobiia bacterium]
MADRIVAVGLGPAGADHLLPVARAALLASSHRYARTLRHPAVDDLLAAGLTFISFDDAYDAAPDLGAAYEEIAARLVAAAHEHGDVVYAVPGSPAVAERTVALLRADPSVDVELVAGVSFADLAWVRLGVDPMDGDARVVDGRAIEASPSAEPVELAGRLLVAQCDNRFVLSDVKLALLEHLGPDTPVTVLQRLGLPDELITVVALEELDRGAVVPDHLTSVFVDAGAVSAAREVVRLLQLTKRLRDPGGCPWDAEQSHHSLTRYLLEESYEVVEAVENLPEAGFAPLEDELGDLLYQVVFHAVIAEETGEFTMADVARGIHDKLVRRHPHVFGDVVADETADVLRNWEQIKKEEKGTTSIVAGITPGLPSLLYTHKLFRKAASVGLDIDDVDAALDRLDAALVALRGGDAGSPDGEAQLAQVLAASVIVARAEGVDAESALRGWAADYRRRFEAVERDAAAQGVDIPTLWPDHPNP